MAAEWIDDVLAHLEGRRTPEALARAGLRVAEDRILRILLWMEPFVETLGDPAFALSDEDMDPQERIPCDHMLGAASEVMEVLLGGLQVARIALISLPYCNDCQLYVGYAPNGDRMSEKLCCCCRRSAIEIAGAENESAKKD